MDQVPYQVRKRITMVSQRAVAGRCWMVKSILVECAASQQEGEKPYCCGNIWERNNMLMQKIQTVKIGWPSNVVEHILLYPSPHYCLGSAVKIAGKCLLAQRDTYKIKHSNASQFFPDFLNWFSETCQMYRALEWRIKRRKLFVLKANWFTVILSVWQHLKLWISEIVTS